MANQTISQLPNANALTGTELVPIVQDGGTVKTTVADIAATPTTNYSFVTATSEGSLSQSRQFSTSGLGLTLTDNGAGSTLNLSLSGTPASLANASTGLMAKDTSTSVAARSIQAGTAGLSIANGSGVAGNPTISLSGMPLYLAQSSGVGLLTRTSGSSVGVVTLTGTTNQIDIANGTGDGANPTVSLASNPIIPGTASAQLPSGTTGQRPAGTNGQIRFNTTTQTFEGYANGWGAIAVGSGVTSITLSTGLSGSPNPITSTGTIQIDTGVVATLTGMQTLTNKTISGASNTLSNIGNASLSNSSVTVNGTPISLGGSATITAATVAALTFGTGLSGGSFDGGSAVTVAIANSGVTANTYGSASAVPVFAVNAQGQLTSVTNTNIAIAASQVTSGTLAIAQGGTNGSATPTAGAVPYGNGTAYAFSSAGNASEVLLSGGTGSPTWAAQSSLSVGTATNAVNIGITDDTSTNATMYPVWVTANTGNLPAKVTSTKLSFNPSTGVLTATGGIAGGAF